MALRGPRRLQLAPSPEEPVEEKVAVPSHTPFSCGCTRRLPSPRVQLSSVCGNGSVLGWAVYNDIFQRCCSLRHFEGAKYSKTATLLTGRWEKQHRSLDTEPLSTGQILRPPTDSCLYVLGQPQSNERYWNISAVAGSYAPCTVTQPQPTNGFENCSAAAKVAFK